MLNIQKNILLSKYTTFKIGGRARFFCIAENVDEIKGALEFAKKNKLNIFILGGGSNLLVSDNGFDGIVIKITNYKLQITDNKIICGSGLSLAKLVNESIKNDLTGLEWAAGIPGITVGGAIANNAGAFGKCMGDVVESVEILDIRILGNWDIGILNNEQCEFSYRDSVFKRSKKYIILNAVLKLERGKQEESQKTIEEYLQSRKEKQPLEYPNAGSVFKNPLVENKLLAKLTKEFPELKNIAKNNLLPAGWLIETLGLKGKKIGGAMISEKHCNFIVNFDNAKADDVVILISLIKQKARDNFGVQLKEEIEYVGF